MKPVLAIMTLLLVLVIAFAATTWWALESGGVAILETRTPEGAPRATHVWFVERDGEIWLEAGSPQNGWFLDIQETPELIFNAEGRLARYVARPVESATGHDEIRSMLREKYGSRDQWVGLLVDSSQSIAVRLVDPTG